MASPKSWIARDIVKLKGRTREERLTRSADLIIRRGIQGTAVAVKKTRGGGGGSGAVWL